MSVDCLGSLGTVSYLDGRYIDGCGLRVPRVDCVVMVVERVTQPLVPPPNPVASGETKANLPDASIHHT